MSPLSQAIRIETIGPVTVVYLGPEFESIDETSVSALSAVLKKVGQEARPPTVVVDLSMVGHCKPQLLGLFVQMQTLFKASKGCLILAGVRQSVRDILNITRLDRVLVLEESTSAAIANLTTSVSELPP